MKLVINTQMIRKNKDNLKDFRHKRKGSDFKKPEPSKTKRSICDIHEDGA